VARIFIVPPRSWWQNKKRKIVESIGACVKEIEGAGDLGGGNEGSGLTPLDINNDIILIRNLMIKKWVDIQYSYLALRNNYRDMCADLLNNNNKLSNLPDEIKQIILTNMDYFYEVYKNLNVETPMELPPTSRNGCPLPYRDSWENFTGDGHNDVLVINSDVDILKKSHRLFLDLFKSKFYSDMYIVCVFDIIALEQTVKHIFMKYVLKTSEIERKLKESTWAGRLEWLNKVTLGGNYFSPDDLRKLDCFKSYLGDYEIDRHEFIHGGFIWHHISPSKIIGMMDRHLMTFRLVYWLWSRFDLGGMDPIIIKTNYAELVTDQLKRLGLFNGKKD
jgi:hypothetical protein